MLSLGQLNAGGILGNYTFRPMLNLHPGYILIKKYNHIDFDQFMSSMKDMFCVSVQPSIYVIYKRFASVVRLIIMVMVRCCLLQTVPNHQPKIKIIPEILSSLCL